MRTAREVIAEAIFADDMGCPGDSVDFAKESERCRENYGRNADAALAALRAEGLVIVAAADVAMADSFIKSMCASFTARGHDMADYYLLANRLDAALAAGDE